MDAKEFPEFADKYKESFGEEVNFDNVYLYIDRNKDYLISQSQLVETEENSESNIKDNKYVIYSVEFNKGKLIGKGARIEYHQKEDMNNSDGLYTDRYIKIEDKDNNFEYTINQDKDKRMFTIPSLEKTQEIVNGLKKERLKNIFNSEKRKELTQAIELFERLQIPLYNKYWLKINDTELQKNKNMDLSKEEEDRQKRVKRFGELRKLVIQKREKLAKAKAKQLAKEQAKQRKMQKSR